MASTHERVAPGGRGISGWRSTVLALSLIPSLCGGADAPSSQVSVPRTWDDAEMASIQLPLAYGPASPKHAPASYYYRISVRPIYRQYPVYAPGHEPPGYMDRLKKAEPEIVWDDNGHKPPLKTEADWIKAGEIVFDQQISRAQFFGVGIEDVRRPEWYEENRVVTTRGGVLPFFAYIIREKGKVELGGFACGMCHTRVMADGTVLKGAQGNLAIPLNFNFATSSDANSEFARTIRRALWSAPWVDPDPLPALSSEQLRAINQATPPGVFFRQGSSPVYPVHTPDLIGVKERRYLDATGLQHHRSVGDLMRYAALNQGGDDLASFQGFIPADTPSFSHLPDPAKVNGRYSDEQLYALALYLYSLKPPPNPNRIDQRAKRGEKVFAREGCANCHTPPLFTNNKLTLAEGSTRPADADDDVLPISVGTDPGLATKTRRGTGYYKVPSLKGVWYRGMFGHSGWCATLEDWFDPRRTRDDYTPTGFRPFGAKMYAVKGHRFGLDLSPEDRAALITFLKTL